ncbi:hypothetical protein PGT21_031800 [Puccinia graminis f. sp. tritici]|uniref:Uncharacterized protein n=2 Tax=Puccinia graminis f. sp. tritici TaxID=56615 RepID=A0A5B0PB70_PUCGR|nr:hypothetical protein PGT21_031800 [Puccinia graminis f. sp. tritici]
MAIWIVCGGKFTSSSRRHQVNPMHPSPHLHEAPRGYVGAGDVGELKMPVNYIVSRNEKKTQVATTSEDVVSRVILLRAMQETMKKTQPSSTRRRNHLRGCRRSSQAYYFVANNAENQELLLVNDGRV